MLAERAINSWATTLTRCLAEWTGDSWAVARHGDYQRQCKEGKWGEHQPIQETSALDLSLHLKKRDQGWQNSKR